MRFDTGNKFLAELMEHNLYCVELGMYMYTYNDGASVVQYYIDDDEAKELAQLAYRTGDYWEAFIGPGGHIYDGVEGLEFLDEYKNYDWIPV